MKQTLEQLIQKIQPVDNSYSEKMHLYHGTLLTPTNALQVPLSYVEKLASIYKSVPVKEFRKKRLVIFAAFHGIVEEGVSAYPQEVTQQMVLSFVNNLAVITSLSNNQNMDMVIVDLGVKGKAIKSPKVITKKIAQGTKNFLKEDAMTKEQVEKAIEIGIRIAQKTKKEGYSIAIVGEMGIGNTTSASLLTAALLNLPPKMVTGHGTGINEKTYKKKIKIIENTLFNRNVSQLHPLEVLQKVGGFEIAGMCGFLLGAAIYNLPVLLDGFITGAAALVAYRIAPLSKEYWIAGHTSLEVGHKKVLEALGLRPILDLDLRLGEGSGAAFALPILEQAIAVSLHTGTFETAKVSHKK